MSYYTIEVETGYEFTAEKIVRQFMDCYKFIGIRNIHVWERKTHQLGDKKQTEKRVSVVPGYIIVETDSQVESNKGFKERFYYFIKSIINFSTKIKKLLPSSMQQAEFLSWCEHLKVEPLVEVTVSSDEPTEEEVSQQTKELLVEVNQVKDPHLQRSLSKRLKQKFISKVQQINHWLRHTKDQSLAEKCRVFKDNRQDVLLVPLTTAKEILNRARGGDPEYTLFKESSFYSLLSMWDKKS